jgi:hypothetical protein
MVLKQVTDHAELVIWYGEKPIRSWMILGGAFEDCYSNVEKS